VPESGEDVVDQGSTVEGPGRRGAYERVEGTIRTVELIRVPRLQGPPVDVPSPTPTAIELRVGFITDVGRKRTRIYLRASRTKWQLCTARRIFLIVIRNRL